MKVGGQTLARVATLINSHPRLTRPQEDRVNFKIKCVKSFTEIVLNFISGFKGFWRLNFGNYTQYICTNKKNKPGLVSTTPPSYCEILPQ